MHVLKISGLVAVLTSVKIEYFGERELEALVVYTVDRTTADTVLLSVFFFLLKELLRRVEEVDAASVCHRELLVLGDRVRR